ncbi:MAG: hypothetical protein JXB38_12500 [Anaerolineales bacterium]|nr:hypothetical protein [Anaerolineales bacterium]
MKFKQFIGFAYRAIVVQTLTYFVAGLLASTLLDYAAKWGQEIMAIYMRPITHPLVMAGPLLQIGRGLVFALALIPFYEAIFKRKLGWLALWGLFLGFAILSPVSAAPGSIEGMIYTNLPFGYHFFGWPEVFAQTLAFCLLLYYWENHPEKKWLTWLLTICYVLIAALLIMGLLVTYGA